LIPRSAWWALAVIAIACAVLLTGCETLPPIASPGEPRMILEGEGRVRLAAYDGSRKEFIDLGWHDAASLRGWTIADYDWRESDGMEAHPIDPR
jgi:hypothetical protein